MRLKLFEILLFQKVVFKTVKRQRQEVYSLMSEETAIKV